MDASVAISMLRTFVKTVGLPKPAIDALDSMKDYRFDPPSRVGSGALTFTNTSSETYIFSFQKETGEYVTVVVKSNDAKMLSALESLVGTGGEKR
jgi:hypothetical protein